MSCRHICHSNNLQPHQQRCVYKISPQKPHTIYKLIFALHVSYISSTHSPSWRRYTFLSHLTTKSKISVRWIKKLVAATCGVCVSIHLYNLAIVTVTAGTVCPAAIYVVRTIYNPTNNVVPIQYLPQNPIQFIHISSLYTFPIFPPPIIPFGGDTPFYLISRRNQRFLFDG